MRSFVCQYFNYRFYSEFVKILIGRTPGVIIMYVSGILEKTVVKEFWQNAFAPCMYKHESMQVIYISCR